MAHERGWKSAPSQEDLIKELLFMMYNRMRGALLHESPLGSEFVGHRHLVSLELYIVLF